MKRTGIIQLIISSLLIALFVYTGTSKLLDHTNFEFALSRFPLLSPVYVLLSWFIPIAELGIGILLFFKRSRLTGFFLSLITMIIFTVYLVYAYWLSGNRPCTCGGILRNLSWPVHIAINLFFAFISFSGIVINKRKTAMTGRAPP
ncbi:MAG: MauE/DoxX family redox-associated membrane protein [Ferruginibacter sp.]